MTEATFKKKVIEDTKLRDEEKSLINETLKEEREDKLLGKQQVFG